MRRLSFSFLLVALLCIPAGAEPRPAVDQILRKLVENSEAPASVDGRNRFGYRRASKVLYLDEKGLTKKQSLRIYSVAPQNGRPVTTLLSINGKPAADNDHANRSAAREAGEKSRMLPLSDGLVSRYDFTFAGEDSLSGRKMWVLHFVPKPKLPSDGFLDKLVNAMTGTVWIDQEEFQLAKADLRLSRKIAFFGGIAGAIDKLNISIAQQRLEPEVWLNHAIDLDFSGRKLFSPMRFRCLETCSEFRKITEHASR